MINFPTELTKDLVLGFLLFSFLLFGIFSIVLDIHWKQYTVGVNNLKGVRVIYFAVSGLLYIGMVIFLLKFL